MAVDFRSVFSLDREDLTRFEAHRVGRLNPVATEHFREKLAEFFRRYPYDPWYPLSREEFEIYLKETWAKHVPVATRLRRFPSEHNERFGSTAFAPHSRGVLDSHVDSQQERVSYDVVCFADETPHGKH